MTFDGWQATVQEEFAVPIYKDIWGDCAVHENDSLADDESTALVLDYGDVDKIILRNNGTQIHMAQRFRKPFYSKRHDEWRDPDFTLRYSRPTSDNTVEYERLMSAHESGNSAYPRRYAFGRVHNDATKGLYELYIFDTDKLIDTIKSGLVDESGPIQTDEGQEMMAYSVDELIHHDVAVHKWDEENNPSHDTKRPDDPENVTAWAEVNSNA